MFLKFVVIALFCTLTIVKSSESVKNENQNNENDTQNSFYVRTILNYLINSNQNKIYDYKKGILVSAQQKANITEVVIDVEVSCANKYPGLPCAEQTLTCHGFVGEDEQTGGYQVLSDVTCSPKIEISIENVDENKPSLPIPRTTNAEENIELSNEAVSADQSAADFVAVRRDSLPCLGCPFDLNTNAEGVEELLHTALKHVESEKDQRHKVLKILKVQQQIVAGVKYILLIEVAPTSCQKDADISQPCPLIESAPSIICEIIFVQQPWISKNKHIIKNNCTVSQEYTLERSHDERDDLDNEIDANGNLDKLTEVQDKTPYFNGIAESGNMEPEMTPSRLADLESQILFGEDFSSVGHQPSSVKPISMVTIEAEHPSSVYVPQTLSVPEDQPIITNINPVTSEGSNLFVQDNSQQKHSVYSLPTVEEREPLITSEPYVVSRPIQASEARFVDQGADTESSIHTTLSQDSSGEAKQVIQKDFSTEKSVNPAESNVEVTANESAASIGYATLEEKLDRKKRACPRPHMDFPDNESGQLEPNSLIVKRAVHSDSSDESNIKSNESKDSKSDESKGSSEEKSRVKRSEEDNSNSDSKSDESKDTSEEKSRVRRAEKDDSDIDSKSDDSKDSSEEKFRVRRSEKDDSDSDSKSDDSKDSSEEKFRVRRSEKDDSDSDSKSDDSKDSSEEKFRVRRAEKDDSNSDSKSDDSKDSSEEKFRVRRTEKDNSDSDSKSDETQQNKNDQEVTTIIIPELRVKRSAESKSSKSSESNESSDSSASHEKSNTESTTISANVIVKRSADKNNKDDSSSSSSSSSSEEKNDKDRNQNEVESADHIKKDDSSSSSSSTSEENNNNKSKNKSETKHKEKKNDQESSSSSSDSSNDEDNGKKVREERAVRQMEKITSDEKALVRDLADFAAASLDKIDDDNHKRVILQILGAKKLKLDGIYYQIIMRLGISHCREHDRDEECREKLLTNLTKICKVQVHVDDDYSNPKVVKSQCQNIKKDENDRNRTNYSRYKRGVLVGGPSDIPINDSRILDYTKEPLLYLDSKSSHGTKYKINKVLSATSQVVAGVKYVINAEIALTKCNKEDTTPADHCDALEDSEPKVCKITIWERPWLNKKETTINCDNETLSFGSESKRTRRALGSENELEIGVSSYVDELLGTGLTHLSERNQKTYKLKNVLTVKKQLVAGFLWTVEAEISSSACETETRCVEDMNTKVCEFRIWDKPWLVRRTNISCGDNEEAYSFLTFKNPSKNINKSFLENKATEYIETGLEYLNIKSLFNTRYILKSITFISAPVKNGGNWYIHADIARSDCVKQYHDENCEPIESGQKCNFTVVDHVRPASTKISITCENDDNVYSFFPDTELTGGMDNDEALQAFKDFMVTHKKSYSNKIEYNYRLKVFRDNLKTIHLLNKNEQGTGRYGITKFADLTQKEFSHSRGLRLDLRSENEIPFMQAEIPNVKLPVEFDWRKKNAVTEVKNQGMCGSCWAFSVTGNVEGQYAIKHGNLTEFSEQELVDCDKVDEGCNGGLMDNAYRVIENLGGLESESDYPYEGEDEKCHFDKGKIVVELTGALNISHNETDMAKWLVANGPISIAINANAMQFYMGGVSHPYKVLCNPKNLDHGVLIVGYGVHQYPMFKKSLPFWIVKNSWGTSWGEQGYYRVFRGDGTCGLNQTPSSAVVA